MKKITAYFLTFCLFSAFGCIPALERPPAVEPEPYVITPHLVPPDPLKKKIRFLNNILKKDNLPDRDKMMALDLLNAYRLVERLSQKSDEAGPDYITGPEYHRVIRALFNSLALLDENCFSEKRDHTQDYPEPVSYFVNKRNEILNTYLSGDFKTVINHCLGLKTLFGPDAISPEIGVVFALSLAVEGMLEEAIDIGERTANDLRAYPDLVHLRAKIAEWHLELDERKKALVVYEKLTDIVDEQQAMVQSLGRKITGRPITQKLPHPEMDAQTKKQMDECLKEVDRLVQEHNFSEAKALLILKRKEASSPAEIEIVRQALEGLETAQDRYVEDKISMLSRKKQTLKLARKLVEKEEFEEAISSLDALQTEQGKTHEITELKEQATEKLINSERNRAAKIFLTAKKTQDPAKKEEYLRSSYEILKALIDKYPLSPLNKKLKSHIKKVTEELHKLETGAVEEEW